MPILASEALLSENKKKQWKILPSVGIEPGPLITFDSKSNIILSGLTRHVLLIRSLNFCSCTTWFLDLDDSVRFNRAWLYREPKVSVLQANNNLVQNGQCWTWKQGFMIGPGSILNICHWNFWFSRSIASDANIGIFAILANFEKRSIKLEWIKHNWRILNAFLCHPSELAVSCSDYYSVGCEFKYMIFFLERKAKST